MNDIRPDGAAWALMCDLVLHRNAGKTEVAEVLGMSYARVKALRHVAAAGTMPMRDLVAELGSDAPYVTVLVDDLEARGLVTRTPHPDDRRAKVVAVTAAGRRAARKAETILARPPAAFARLTDAEVDNLYQLLATITG